jgi:hypothetical protein
MFAVAKRDDVEPEDQALRAVRVEVNEAFTEGKFRFNEIYEPSGGGSIVPEKLIHALLLQVF